MGFVCVLLWESQLEFVSWWEPFRIRVCVVADQGEEIESVYCVGVIFLLRSLWYSGLF